MITKFFVAGIPAPGGSKRIVPHPKSGKPLITSACKRSRPWMRTVAKVARKHFDEPLTGPVEFHFTFVLPRPKKHYGTGKNAEKLKESAPAYHTIAPDSSKLTRAAEDALKGIAWKDDSQVVKHTACKDYGAFPGVHIEVRSLEGPCRC